MVRIRWVRTKERQALSNDAAWAMAGRVLRIKPKVRDHVAEGRRWQERLTKAERIAGLRGMLMRSRDPKTIARIEARLAELEDPWSLD